MELNYSSDVDLMFIFGDGEEPAERRFPTVNISSVWRSRSTDILSRPTREGAVFRIDLRLRLKGNEGELAISMARAQDYYATAAHDWERQALIKIRHSAGDIDWRESLSAASSRMYIPKKLISQRSRRRLVAREGCTPTAIPNERWNRTAKAST